MLRKTIILLLLLLFLPTIYAITFFTDSDATLLASCRNLTYVESTAKLIIRYPNTTVWKANVSMNVISIGQFNYSFITTNVTGNYPTTVECTIGGVVGYDEDEFLVREQEEEMTSMAVIIFIMLITIGVFFAPKLFGKFSNNKYLDSTLKGLCIMFGLFLLSLDAVIVVTVADKAKLGITKEIFRYLWLINWAAYIAMFIVVLTFGWRMLQMWQIDKYNKSMGFDEDGQE